MEFYPHGEDDTEEDYFDEPTVDDEAILRRYAKLKIFRRYFTIVVIFFFVGVFVAPELARQLRFVFAGAPSPDYLELVDELHGFGCFDPGVVRYSFKYDVHFLNPELLESTFSLAADDWEGALNGLLEFEKVEEGKETDLLVVVVDNLPHPGRAHLEYEGIRYRPRVELNAPQLTNRHVLRLVVAHELGHVLGIWGHSDHPGDLMYAMPVRAGPSRRDVKTIRLIYGLE